MATSLKLTGKKVGPIGFGLMGFTWRESPPSQEQAFEAMRAAIKNGCKSMLLFSSSRQDRH
jgi:pyridoxine 4-dehydrogenase